MQHRILIALSLLASSAAGQSSIDAVPALERWLALGRGARPALSEQPFATAALTEEQARRCRDLFVADLARALREERAAEWKAKEVHAGKNAMRFEYTVFGSARPGKRRLFISLHGGGSAPREVNDRQWRNQIGLYRPKEGVYLAPRAPTDTWDMWHREHVDVLLDRIIEDAILFEGVDPDRVYLMGYSAGGDGVYQVAPRLADRFAAAAMMAGHPNETRPDGLRNLPFTLHVGADDAAYERNAIARKWKEALAALRASDRGGYPHEVVIHAHKGHWMDREDAVAVPWMSRHVRRRRPRRVVWLQDDVVHGRFYWLGMPDGARKPRTAARVRIDGNRVVVEQGTTATALTIWLDDDLVDLGRPVVVVVECGEAGGEAGGEAARPRLPDERRVTRTIRTMAETLRLDPAAVYFARIDVVLD